jgi:hypothetical protein
LGYAFWNLNLTPKFDSMFWIQQAKASLGQTLRRYEQQLANQTLSPRLQARLQTAKDQLQDAIAKLDETLLRVAVFGMVSRGKSAVINGLIGHHLLPTGPLHGVTKYPRSVYWSPEGADTTLSVELIDTPGLDEVGGTDREAIAQEIADRADLILLVVAGEITRTEYNALGWLSQTHKPLLLVGNKQDRFPEETAATLLQKFRRFDPDLPAFEPENVVFVAAEPAPIQVRVEYADGRVSDEWETPPAQMEALQARLLPLLQQEGTKLLALNALRQAQQTEQDMARETIQIQADRAQVMIDKFIRWKAIAIAANPVPGIDLLGGLLVDLVLIRSLARLYGLPMTSHQANKMLNTLLLSSGGLLLGELGSGLLPDLDSAGGLLAYVPGAIAQAALAGYGVFRVSKTARTYLQEGCTWGDWGSSRAIQAILDDSNEPEDGSANLS